MTPQALPTDSDINLAMSALANHLDVKEGHIVPIAALATGPDENALLFYFDRDDSDDDSEGFAVIEDGVVYRYSMTECYPIAL